MMRKYLGFAAVGMLLAILFFWHYAPRTGTHRTVSTAEQPVTRAAASRPVDFLAAQQTVSPATRPAIDVLEGVDAWLEQWREQHAASATAPASDATRSAEPGKADLDAAADLLLAGRYDRALAAFDRLLVRQPNDVQLMMGEAAALVGLARAEDALPLLESVLRLQPANIPARFNYGVALIRAGQPEAAAAQFATVLERSPGHVEAKFNLAILHQAAGRYHPAIALWRELTDAAPTQPATSKQTKPSPSKRPSQPTNSRRPVQQTASTRATWQSTSIPAAPSHGLSATKRLEALCHRGEIALELHLSDEAERCFRQVLEIEPADARAWCNIGIARADAGRRDDAIEALTQALQLDAGLVPAINQLALVRASVYRDGGDEAARAEAIQLCDRSLALLRHQPNVRSLRDALQNPPEPQPEEMPKPERER
jgi:tetratricopeptide (TPR) repeat protein